MGIDATLPNRSTAQFLDLPRRPAKPRSAGLSHIIDGGIGARQLEDTLRTAAEYIDILKFGWGTAYVDPAIATKVALLRRYGVTACLGGTLMEVAWAQGKIRDYLAWARDLGLPAVEVSRGVAAMSVPEKREVIELAAKHFTVLSEVGRKDADEDLTEQEWAAEAAGDRQAGARWIIAEGRESGNVGLYREDGSVRPEIVAAILRGADLDTVLFDAPRKSQQAWFIQEFGPEVNLANLAVDAVIGVETLRLGLRADTFGLSQQWSPILP